MSLHSSPEESLAVNDLLDTLSHHVRREVVHHFEQTTTDATATLDELIRYIEPRVELATREELEVSLPHSHLPYLEARGWLEFDQRNEDIQYYGHDDGEEYLGELTSVFTN
ncbi:hypothetical protein HWV07_15460 [Natronomonas salina]|uniref:DUF7344 domain-containing protein n=1 Tax=Natronomonas salina TaxID=1710540 RepID=UPI0015B74B21|nr:hypothetical protein [Natronomonas salina]QLD90357.1 hypothetical protein HWV07_15460 [Natronomonas salina]